MAFDGGPDEGLGMLLPGAGGLGMLDLPTFGGGDEFLSRGSLDACAGALCCSGVEVLAAPRRPLISLGAGGLAGLGIDVASLSVEVL